MSHTPGPWRIIEDDFEGEGEIWLWIDGANSQAVCGFSDPETGVTDQHRADARLIAVAPELLETCQALLQGFTSG